jgi:uncharacterized protein (UPF0333 family)
MQRKGQAAMEFLMTYGWAILAAVIAIGVLAYFGVFSPGKYMPEVCTLTAPLGCDEFQISAATTPNSINLIVRNGAGEGIFISNFTVDGCGSNSTVGANPVSLTDGSTATMLLQCSASPGTTMGTGDKFRGDITVAYNTSDATFKQTSTGSVSGKAV